MIARFSTLQLAQEYADAVQSALEATNIPGQPKKYIGERWSEVIEIEGAFYVPVFEGLQPTTHEELVTDLPQQTTEE